MARRRGVGGALGAGIGAGLSELGAGLGDLAMKRYESDLISQRQMDLSNLNQKQALLEKALQDPAFARRMQKAGLDKALGLTLPQPTAEDIQSPIMAMINAAKGPTDLPTNEQMAAIDTMSGGQFSTDGGKDFTGGQIPIGIDAILARTRARDSRMDQFKQAELTKPAVAEYPNDQGQMVKEYTTQEGMQGSVLPSEPSPAQKAAAAGQSAGAEARARAPYDNTIVEGVGEGGPGFYRINRQGGGATPIPGAAPTPSPLAGANRPPTEAQERARGFLPSLLSADGEAQKMEQRGVGLGMGTQTIGNQPGLSRLLPKDQLAYLQHSQDFLNFATLILTGVTARPDEYTRYASTLFAFAGEPPAVVIQKQRSRKTFIESVKQRANMGERFGTVEEMMNALGVQPTEGAAAAAGVGPTGQPNSLRDRFRAEQGQ